MQKTYTLLLCGMILFSGTAAALPARLAPFVAKSDSISTAKARKQVAEASVKYLPVVEMVSVWDAEAREWFPEEELHNQYDPQGRLISYQNWDAENGGEDRMQTTITYDAFGNKILEIVESSSNGGDNWENSTKMEYTFDSVVRNFPTSICRYGWYNGDWQLSYGNRYPVTRNADGTVTKVERLANMGIFFDPIARVENTVGADGRTVVKYLNTELQLADDNTSLVWNEIIELQNIVWHQTNGQVLGFEFEDLYQGENRIASADLMYYGEPDGKVRGTYTDEFQGRLEVEFSNGDKMVLSREYTDAATGSYTETSTLDYADNGTTVHEVKVYRVDIDSYGHVTLEESSITVDGELMARSGSKTDYTYGPQGQPLEAVISGYDMDLEEYVPEIRTESTEFVTIAGVDGIVAVPARAEIAGRVLNVTSNEPCTCTVFGLDGRSVAAVSGNGNFSLSLDSLNAGIYVVRVATAHGVTAFKAALR